MTNKELFGKFLENGDVSRLSPREQEIAWRVSLGEKYSSIATDYAVTEERIRGLTERIKGKIERGYAMTAKVAELQSLAANLKAAGKPLSGIPIDELFPIRLEYALRNAEVATLGDIVEKGDRALRRVPKIGETGLEKIRETLAYFGATLPE